MERTTALVTGSRRGIGRGIAEALARERFSLIINGLAEEVHAREAMESCRALGSPKTIYCGADIGEASGRRKLVDTVLAQFGRLDVLVNNAGIAPRVRSDILSTTEDSFDRVLSTNLKGPYFLTQMIANSMIDERKSDPAYRPMIINISSISAYASSTMRGEYCISKAGISMMTRLFADRLAPEGINVYEIRPGIIATDMTSAVEKTYETLIENGLTPIRRWGQPEDIGKAIVAFVKGFFPFSTGEAVNVDGGFHLRRL